MNFLPRVCDPSLFSRLPGTQFPVSMIHSGCSSPGTLFLEEAWWDMMIEHFNLDLYVEISQYDNEQRYQILLGKKPRTDIDELYYERFLKL